MIKFTAMMITLALSLLAAGTLGQGTPALRTVDGNVDIRVPAGKGFSVSCPEVDGEVSCSGTDVEVVDGTCVPRSAFVSEAELSSASSTLQGLIDGVSTRVTDLSGSIETVSSTLAGGVGGRVIVVAMYTTENCTFGSCIVSMVTKPVGTPVALVQNVPIYSCKFQSPYLSAPVMSEPTISSDGYTVDCAVPNHTYPSGLPQPFLEVSADLYEGAIGGSNGSLIPHGHGATGDLLVESRTFLKNPSAPIIAAPERYVIYGVNVPSNNRVQIPIIVEDYDTSSANITVRTQSPMQTSITRSGNSGDWIIQIAGVDNNSARYTQDILIIATDNNGQSSNRTIQFTFISNLSPTIMPDGSTIQLVHQFQNIRTDISVPHYNNIITNFRPTPISLTITSVRDNSKFFVKTQAVFAVHGGSHRYVDIWRQIGTGGFTSVAVAMAGANADGLVSEHPHSGTSGWYEQEREVMVLDEPNVPAGTRITYRIYVGAWGSQTITIGSHRSNNNNGNAPEHFVIQEIANGDCYSGSGAGRTSAECISFDTLPLGSPIQTLSSFQNMQYDLYAPHYNNMIANFRPTNMQISFESRGVNSSFLVQSQFGLSSHSGSHDYTDIFRQIEDGPFESCSQLAAGTSADGLISEHPYGSIGTNYDYPRYPFVVDKPNVPSGTRITYKVYVGAWGGSWFTMGGTRNNNHNGDAPEHFVVREILATQSATSDLVPPASLPRGAIYNTQESMQTIHADIGVPSYGNNIANFRPTTMIYGINTSVTNAKVFVRAQFTVAFHTGSHQYVDIWRSINSQPYTSLSRRYVSDADGLISTHPPGSTGGYYENGKFPFIIDSPNQPAGTRITYRIYVGVWSGGTVTMGSHRLGNENGNSPELFVLQEIAP